MGPKLNQVSNNKEKDSDVKQNEEKTNLVIKVKPSGMLKILLLIASSLLLLAGVHIYFENVVLSYIKENASYQAKFNAYKSKYDELINYNLYSKQDADDNQIKDFTSENSQVIEGLKNKVKELRKYAASLEAKYETQINELISGQLENFEKEIKIRQDEANDNYLKDLKALKKREKTKLGNTQFNYYYRYNSTERDLFNNYLRPYTCDPGDILTLFDDIKKNTTTVYEEFDNSKSNNKDLKEAEILLKMSAKQWESYTKQKIIEANMLKEEASSEGANKKTIFINIITKIREVKSKTKSHLINILSGNFEFKDYYHHIYKAFGNKAFNFRLLFNSNKHDSKESFMKEMKEIQNQEHLLLYAQTTDDRLLGGYLSIPFPAYETLDEEYVYDDINSFIFEFKAKENIAQVFPAHKFGRVHFFIRNSKAETIFFGFGNLKNDEGIAFRFKQEDSAEGSIAYTSFGKKPVAFNISDEKSEFNSNEFGSPAHKIKGIKIYKIDFLE